jgi:hypothetical protein
MVHELKARAKYEVGERVSHHGAPWFVVARYWRRSTDAILYDLKEDLGALKIRAKNKRKVAEEEVLPVRRG